jgi:acyl-coenzyme A synthetase/AMP-(fatty) acid ligase
LVVLWESLHPGVDEFKILAMPNFETFLVDEKVEKCPFKLTCEESKNDPVFIASTSGSTGSPPIWLKHSLSYFTGLPKPDHFTSYMVSIYNRGDFWPKLQNLRALVAMKSFWSLGLNFQIHMPLDVGMISILPPNAPWPLTASYSA